MTVTELVLASGAIGAIFALIQQLVMWSVNRRAAKKDSDARSMSDRMADVEHKMDKLTAGQIAILHDRIKWLGLGYIKAGKISLDDREVFLQMHQAYHDGGGNGNLNSLKEAVINLPLKEE